MHKYAPGDLVEIAFSRVSSAERERLEKAVSGKKKLPSKVDQKNHQKNEEYGEILSLSEDRGNGAEYLVNVDTPGAPRGRKRLVREEKLTILS